MRYQRTLAALSSIILVTVLLISQAAAGVLDDLMKTIPGRSMRSTSAARNPDGSYAHANQDRLAKVKPGETVVVLDAKGPGVVTHMWFTFLGPAPHRWEPKGAATHQEMLIRVYYDGNKRPGVEVPFGDFFANAFGKRSEVISTPIVVEDADSYNSFWRMPFKKSIRIEVVNQSKTKNIGRLYYNIDWIKQDKLPKDTPYFYAQYRQEYPVQQGKDYVILDTKGKGHYVGTVLSVRMRSPAWFGEGDEKIYIDGEKKASIWGTGTEDYFLSAWGLKKTITPNFGTPYFDQRGPGGHVSSYRWHLHDPIVFSKEIRVTIEHWGWMSPDENPDYKSTSWNERQDDYSSVAFWYQTGTPTFEARVPDASERILPSLDPVVYMARDAKFKAKDAKAYIQKSDIYPKGQLFFKPTTEKGATLEIPFTVTGKKEPRRLVLAMTKAPDYGKYRAFLNGVELPRKIDLYSPTAMAWDWHLLDFWPEPGECTLRLECIGKNSKSTNNYLGVESVRLRERRPRVKAWAHDKEKDWRKDPKLYR